MPALTMDDGFIFNNKKNLPPIVSTMQNSHQPLSSSLACCLFFCYLFGFAASIDKGCVTNSAQKPPNKMHNLTKIITMNWIWWIRILFIKLSYIQQLQSHWMYDNYSFCIQKIPFYNLEPLGTVLKIMQNGIFY